MANLLCFFLGRHIYLFHSQSIHIDKSYINSNKTIHRINDKNMIMLR